MGLSTLVLAWRTRIPTTAAWSTPGAALLDGAGAATGSFGEAVGAFLVCAALIVASGLRRPLADLVARIPASIAQAMLAGVLLPRCAQVVTGLKVNPWSVAGAWKDESARLPVVGTFVVAASGVSFFGVSQAMWALVAGLVLLAVLRKR